MTEDIQSFSVLQSRNFFAPGSFTKSTNNDVKSPDVVRGLAKLCPSMDLILVRICSSSSSSSLVIYRTLSWQRVAAIPLQDCSSKVGGPSFCWSPSGQCVAVAENSSVTLYGVENLVTSAGSGGSGMSSGNIGTTDNISIDDPVKALHWVHFGKNHPTATAPSKEEEAREVSWSYRSHYIDQSTNFLPPSKYYCNEGGVEGLESTKSLPECCTPLSVLCVSTNDMQHRLYLHGRYPLLTFPKCNNGISNAVSSKEIPLVVASNDLSYWFVITPIDNMSAHYTQELSTNNFLTLYYTPFLKRDRYALQQIAALHSSITTHLQTVKRSISIIADNWKTSLKPLDQKLRPLINLLRNYGVEVDQTGNEATAGNPSISKTTLATVFKEYITLGHVSHSSSIANAMDQFFTGVQMNDQLLQRLERSLSASMGNAETTATCSLLRPTQALGWQIQELGGLVQFFDTNTELNTNIDEDSSNCEINKSLMAKELVKASQQMWISAEKIITSIVSGRMLVRDFCRWLRHAGSQVKARGTAPNSVQRENAKKRRVSQAILERLVTVLNNSQQDASLISSKLKNNIGLSEYLLNLKVTEMLTEAMEEGSSMPSSKQSYYRPQSSPSSVRGILYPIPSICESLQQAFQATKSLFSNPLSNVPSQIFSKGIFLPRTLHNKECTIALHSRIGRDPSSYSLFWDDDDDDDDGGGQDRSYFLPNISKSNRYATFPPSGLENCRQWFLIAQASKNVVQMFCIPLGWKEETFTDTEDLEIDDDESNEMDDIPFYLTTKLILPTESVVLQIEFYGDDGKSSLSSGIDSGSGMENKQKIGFTFKKSPSSSTIELWTATYELLMWQAIPFDSMLLNASQIDPICSKHVLPISLIDNYHGDEFLFAQNRIVSENQAIDSCELLAPHRGVGGIIKMLPPTRAISSEMMIVSLELLDLEDEEGNEDDDDDDGYEE